MIWVEKCGSRVGVEDGLLQNFLDNGWKKVETEEPKKEEPKEKKSSPKKAKK
jgi:hypothetical protein